MTVTTRSIRRDRIRSCTIRAAILPREHCFHCGGFAIAMTTQGVVICPACSGSGVQ